MVLGGAKPEIIRAIQAGKTAMLKYVKTQHDSKLIHLSWIYDINYPSSFRAITRRGILSAYLNTIPDTPEKTAAAEVLQDYLQRKLR